MFYVALGATAGVLVVRRLSRAVSALSPQSMAGSLVQSVQEFAADVREGMAEREEEIRQALGLDDADPPRDGPTVVPSAADGVGPTAAPEPGRRRR